jgi:hypothetical protein
MSWNLYTAFQGYEGIAYFVTSTWSQASSWTLSAVGSFYEGVAYNVGLTWSQASSWTLNVVGSFFEGTAYSVVLTWSHVSSFALEVSSALAGGVAYVVVLTWDAVNSWVISTITGTGSTDTDTDTDTDHKGGGLYEVGVYAVANGLPLSDVNVTIGGVSKLTGMLGQAIFTLQGGTYKVFAEFKEIRQEMTVYVSKDMRVGFTFNVPLIDNVPNIVKGFAVLCLVILGAIGAVKLATRRKKRRY